MEVFTLLIHIFGDGRSSAKYKGILLGSFSGFGYGIHDDSSFILSVKVNLHAGSNTIDVLSMMIGLQVRMFSVLSPSLAYPHLLFQNNFHSYFE